MSRFGKLGHRSKTKAMMAMGIAITALAGFWMMMS
jgi:hypothetical protein